MQLGVFLPIGNNGWLISTTSPQYKPTFDLMHNWGTRRVTIQVLKWGSFARSLAILKPRAYKAWHVREMVARIESRPA